MKYDQFKNLLNQIRPNSDQAALIWLQWAEELEGYDSGNGGLPEGSYKTAEDFLNTFAEQLISIQERYGTGNRTADDIPCRNLLLPFPVGDEPRSRISCRRRRAIRDCKNGIGRNAGRQQSRHADVTAREPPCRTRVAIFTARTKRIPHRRNRANLPPYSGNTEPPQIGRVYPPADVIPSRPIWLQEKEAGLLKHLRLGSQRTATPTAQGFFAFFSMKKSRGHKLPF